MLYLSVYKMKSLQNKLKAYSFFHSPTKPLFYGEVHTHLEVCTV